MLSGKTPGRDNAGQVTMFDSVGFAMEDFSALRFLHAKAQALQLGAPIALLAQLSDPKDLYQLIRPTPARSAPTARPTRAQAAVTETA